MEMRMFGRTGMRFSLLGFGCGAVGGLIVRGDPADQERTIARAIAAGVNYFDTAVQYGNGESERIYAASCKDSNRPTWSSAPRSGCRAVTSAALPTP
jgi:aryl-alcohol dehydrogenase-like predicted oxidoreductase